MATQEENVDQAITMAKDAGYNVWQTGGGCEAFGKVLKELVEGDFGSHLDILITTEGGTDIDGGPSDAVWEVGVNFQDNNGAETIVSEESLTLAKAIEVARGFEARADEFWAENYTGTVAKPW